MKQFYLLKKEKENYQKKKKNLITQIIYLNLKR